jgi:hypothetical protein
MAASLRRPERLAVAALPWLLCGACGLLASHIEPADAPPGSGFAGFEGEEGPGPGTPLAPGLGDRETPPSTAPAPQPVDERDVWLRLPGEYELAVSRFESPPLREVDGRRLIELTAAPCRIGEQEPTPVEASSAEACRIANLRDIASRSQVAWRLPAGDYRVRVVNGAIDHGTGLSIRTEAGRYLVSRGGGAPGTELVEDVTLRAGRYRVSLPLVPTPEYLWEVR